MSAAIGEKCELQNNLERRRPRLRQQISQTQPGAAALPGSLWEPTCSQMNLV